MCFHNLIWIKFDCFFSWLHSNPIASHTQDGTARWYNSSCLDEHTQLVGFIPWLLNIYMVVCLHVLFLRNYFNVDRHRTIMSFQCKRLYIHILWIWKLFCDWSFQSKQTIWICARSINFHLVLKHINLEMIFLCWGGSLMHCFAEPGSESFNWSPDKNYAWWSHKMVNGSRVRILQNLILFFSWPNLNYTYT